MSAPALDSKRAVEYFQLDSHNLLNRCSGSRMPFEWTINPYRGCEFACRYCYARYTHEFMELRDPDLFDNRIFAKRWNPGDFRASLRRVKRGERIAIGTATDPYQPAERRYGVTRSVLEAINTVEGLQILITTKSDLIVRDLDLLRVIAVNNGLLVNITVTTTDAALARKLEPRAPRPDLRLGALAALRSAGIEAGVFCAPVLPLLSDSEDSLDAVARGAAAAGAGWFNGAPVFLREPSRGVFLEFLDREYPHLAGKYRERFDRSAHLRGAYAGMIQRRIAAVRQRHALCGSAPEYLPADPQYSFDFINAAGAGPLI